MQKGISMLVTFDGWRKRVLCFGKHNYMLLCNVIFGESIKLTLLLSSLHYAISFSMSSPARFKAFL